MLVETLHDLRQRLIELRKQRLVYPLSRASGIPYKWLIMFASGDIGNPRIDTLDRLSRALDAFADGKLKQLRGHSGNGSVKKEQAT